ncbi:MAG: hypothetical protein J1F35_05935 [Erysipelotrichales bacterium]|nr:hypothetical protein [Erysipelotrichales bacterium]
MKKKVISLILASFCFFCANADISYIEQTPSWIKVYSENGSVQNLVSTSNGRLVGYSSKIFILESNSWYYVYNDRGNKISILSKSSVGKIVNVVGDTFISESNSWVYVYNSKGRRISTRSK